MRQPDWSLCTAWAVETSLNLVLGAIDCLTLPAHTVVSLIEPLTANQLFGHWSQAIATLYELATLEQLPMKNLEVYSLILLFKIYYGLKLRKLFKENSERVVFVDEYFVMASQYFKNDEDVRD